MKLCCVYCETAFRVERNGVAVIEMFSDPPRPFRIWHADIWKCPKCNFSVVAGFGAKPVAEHHQADFDEQLAQAKTKTEIVYDYERVAQVKP